MYARNMFKISNTCIILSFSHFMKWPEQISSHFMKWLISQIGSLKKKKNTHTHTHTHTHTRKKSQNFFARIFFHTLTYLVPNERQTFILSSDKVISFEFSG